MKIKSIIRLLLMVFAFSVFSSAQTRLFLQMNMTPPVSPAFGGWTTTTGALRMYLTTTKLGDTTAPGLTINCNATANATCLNRQYVTAPLNGAQTISGTVKGFWIVRELASTDNIDRWPILLKVVDSTLATRCTMLALADYSPGVNEAGTTLVNRILADGDTITTCNAQDGDRIVLEVGFQVSAAGGTTPQGTADFGTSAADCAENETGTTVCTPWFEFSANLSFKGWSYKNSQGANSSSASTLATANWSSTAGSTVVCSVAMFTQTLNTVTDVNGLAFTTGTTQNTPGGGHLYFAYGIGIGGNAAYNVTATTTGGPNELSIACAEFAPQPSTTQAIDQTASAQAATVNVASVTAADLIFGGGSQDTTAVFTAGAGYSTPANYLQPATGDVTTHQPVGIEFNLEGVGGTTTVNFTGMGTGDAIWGLSFKATGITITSFGRNKQRKLEIIDPQ